MRKLTSLILILCLLAGAFTAVNAGAERVEESMPF